MSLLKGKKGENILRPVGSLSCKDSFVSALSLYHVTEQLQI